ncbi:MAG: thiamine phosphate synthase [Pseudomonadota bacterium]
MAPGLSAALQLRYKPDPALPQLKPCFQMQAVPVTRLNALVQRHAALALPEQADATAQPRSASAYDLAWALARRLGFIEADAQVLAAAWQRRSAREGRWRDDWPQDPDDFGLVAASASAQRPKPPDPQHPPPHASAAPPGTPHAKLDPDPQTEPTSFAPCPLALGLYAVLPDAAWVQRLAAAGVPTLQLRYKPDPALPAAERAAAVAAEVRAAVAAVGAAGAPAHAATSRPAQRSKLHPAASPQPRLFINDHWQAAIEAGAYGVHLGQEDLDALPAAALQQMRAAGLRLGLSTHGYAELLRAAALRPSYIALGAVFPTTLKAMSTAPQGCARLRAYAQLLARLRPAIPTVAIGGIDLEHLGAIAASGVGSFAVVRALTASPDPATAAQALQRRWAELRPLTGA